MVRPWGKHEVDPRAAGVRTFVASVILIWSKLQGRRKRNTVAYHPFQNHYTHKILSGPLDRLNAILSLLQPLDRYRAPSAIGSAIGRPLSRPISHPRTGRSPQPPRSKPLRGAQPRDSGAIVSQTPLKQARNENAIEAAILNRVLDRD